MPEVSLLLLASTFIAGFTMFLAPCTLPLVPPFLAYISTAHGERTTRLRLVQNAAAFCVGFSVIFIALGLSTGLLGEVLGAVLPAVYFFVGLMIVLLGMSLLGFFSFTLFTKKTGFPIPSWVTPGSLPSSFLLGALFAVGFTPCIGPIMATVLLIASTEGSGGAGALLLSIFSLGFSIPFLLTAFFYSSALRWISTLSVIARYVRILVGVLLVVLGIIFMVGGHAFLFSLGSSVFYWLGLDILFRFY